ncbi:MAG TPA: DUF1549 domain-containing protein [Lacipirellulaceae bacterium]|nr:DUF1549 domain-containing protein [Lacipirellulaceae bacterium]
MRRLIPCTGTLLVLLSLAAPARAATTDAAPAAVAVGSDPQSVADRVDAALATELFATSEARAALAPRTDDATFLRRAWLDLIGDLPTPEHVIAFALDGGADKRPRAVDGLLADAQYGANWARYWRDVIFYRRIEDRALIAANALEADLSAKLNADVPWDHVAAEFITAQGDVRENGATALIMAQDGRTEETAAEVARIFLGMQIQCAQCHDHPYDRWKREEFHELAAFFPRIAVRPVLSATQRSFAVVASDRPARRRANNNENRPTPEHFMPDLEDPTAPGTRMQPKFFLTSAALPYGAPDEDRRARLADWLTGNEWFAQAAVNRVWAELVGEGFYEPVDDLGPNRTATAPQALAILSEGFRDSGYSMKWLLRTIMGTEAYQRQSRPRRESGQGTPFAANVPQPLRADQLYNCVLSALDRSEPEPARRRGGGGMGGYGRNRGPRGQFNQTFGYDPSDPREGIAGSIPQVLAMMNSPEVAGAASGLRPGLLKRLLAETPADDDLVLEVYLQTLSREPCPDELATAVAYLAGPHPRREAAEDLLWALLNSAEFRHRR